MKLVASLVFKTEGANSVGGTRPQTDPECATKGKMQFLHLPSAPCSAANLGQHR